MYNGNHYSPPYNYRERKNKLSNRPLRLQPPPKPRWRFERRCKYVYPPRRKPNKQGYERPIQRISYPLFSRERRPEHRPRERSSPPSPKNPRNQPPNKRPIHWFKIRFQWSL